MSLQLVKNNRDIALEASTWVTKLETGRMSESDSAAFRAWVKEAPSEREAALDQAIRTLSTIQDSMAMLNEAAQVVGKAPPSDERVSEAPRKIPKVWMAMCASLMLCALLFVTQLSSFLDDKNTATYIAGVGESREVMLPDGSMMTLNTDTQVSLQYTDSERMIHLARGEAVFDVVSNAERPFVVYTNEEAIKAVGTVFAVRASEGAVKVLVEEGIVEVTTSMTDRSSDSHEGDFELDQSNTLPAVSRVTEGEVVTIDKSKREVALFEDSQLVARSLSWRKGVLVFDNEPLRDVIQEFSRYSNVDIVLEGEDINQIPISGVFPLGEVDAFMNALERGFDVDVRLSGEAYHLNRS